VGGRGARGTNGPRIVSGSIAQVTYRNYNEAMVIRCATPDCDWGHPMPPMAKWTDELDECRAALRHSEANESRCRAQA
jgi:hypothetical protein